METGATAIPVPLKRPLPFGPVAVGHISGVVELCDCLDDLVSYSTILCAYPLDVGFFLYFALCFSSPMSGRDIMNIFSLELKLFVREFT